MTATGARRHARERARGHRRSTTIRVVLAGGVLIGVGAAASSAAWTDGAYFQGSASSGSVELQACTSVSQSSCVDADDSGAVQTILPSTAFGGMVPGHPYSASVWIRNNGSVPLAVTSIVNGLAEPLVGTPPNVTLSVSPATVTLDPQTMQQLTVTVTTPTDWDISHANKSNPAALQIVSTGTTQ